MRVEKTQTSSRAAEKNGTHACRQTCYNHRNRRLHQAHRVVNRHPRRNGAAGGIDVKRNRLSGILQFQINELLRNVLGGFIVDFAPKENFPILQKLSLDDAANGLVLLFAIATFLLAHTPYGSVFFGKGKEKIPMRASNYRKKKTTCAKSTNKTSPQVSFRKKFTGRRCISTTCFFLSNAKQCVISLGAFIPLPYFTPV